MEQTEQPIGVFDSGMGGISVLRELVSYMPGEDFLYFGDSKNAPYGTKSLEEVQELTCRNIEYLLGKGAKAIVVACNTATSAAIQMLRDKYPDRIMIGIEPALKPAVLAKEKPNVLVMATPMTLREKKFHNLMARYEEKAQIYPLPCPDLVRYVEHGILEGPELEAYLEPLLAPYANGKVDSVVLGCTHFPLAKETIQKILGTHVVLFDGGAGTAHETYRRLEEKQLRNPRRTGGRVFWENSLQSPEKQRLAEFLLNYAS